MKLVLFTIVIAVVAPVSWQQDSRSTSDTTTTELPSSSTLSDDETTTGTTSSTTLDDDGTTTVSLSSGEVEESRAIGGGNDEVRGNSLYSLTPFRPEQPCASQGGMCVEKEYCDDIADSGTASLCPEQRAQGAACCRRLPNKRLPCSLRGGSCRTSCGRSKLLTPDPLGICPDPLTGEPIQGNLCCPLLH